MKTHKTSFYEQMLQSLIQLFETTKRREKVFLGHFVDELYYHFDKSVIKCFEDTKRKMYISGFFPEKECIEMIAPIQSQLILNKDLKNEIQKIRMDFV